MTAWTKTGVIWVSSSLDAVSTHNISFLKAGAAGLGHLKKVEYL